MSFQFHNQQQRFINDSSNKRLLLGGRQTGKTTVLLALAIDEALSGNKVGFYAPNAAQAKNPLDMLDDEPFISRLSGIVSRKTMNSITISNQPTIDFCSSYNLTQPSRHDVLIADELDYTTVEFKEKLLSHSGRWDSVHAATTPSDKRMSILPEAKAHGFSVTVATSDNNPQVSNDVQYWKKNLKDAEQILFSGTTIDDHCTINVGNEEKQSMMCPNCERSLSIPKDISDPKRAMAEALFYGRLKSEPCDRKI